MQKCKLCALAIAAAFPLASQAALTVSFKAPATGATVSGTLQGAACEATGTEIRRVRFSVDGTALNDDNKSPWTCVLDTTKLANGWHTLMATALDKKGNSTTTQVSINVANAPPPPPPSATPSAVPTFESLGLYWKPASNPGAAGCNVQYRKLGDVDWKDGLSLWYDARNGECRGSLVHLAADTSYEFELSVPGEPAVSGSAKTWSENYPIAQIVHVTDMSQPLSISTGGTADGYVLYTPAPGTTATIDVADAHDHNIVISAPYVIVRGLVVKGARIDAIHLLEGAHDVVIEDNDISGWGRYRTTGIEGWQLGWNNDAGIKAFCTTGPWLERLIVQRNRIHHPRYGTNSWSDGHPAGPNGLHLLNCGGNHVIRYNEVYSEWGRYLKDGIGGGENFSTKGNIHRDSDIYGNSIKHAWDDAITAEGANRNVRIWGNYMDETTTGVASTPTSVGPLYMWRNVWNRGRHFSLRSLDDDGRLYMFKSGSSSTFGDGRRYVFHNTMLQAPPPAGSSYPLGGGHGLAGPNSELITNTVSRNNIFHLWKSWWPAIYGVGSGNDFDFDMTNGGFQAYAGAEPNAIIGTPIYEAGHGWESEAGGNYQLSPFSAGYDRGARIPNFNDAFTGAAPDVGAHEAGMPAMRFGLR